MDCFFTARISYDWVALLLRLAVAVTLLPFGIAKFTKRHDPPAQFFAVLGFSGKTSFYLAMFAETFAPFCLILGFFTRIAALGGCLNMAIAYLEYKKMHKADNAPYYYAPALPILLGYVIVLLMGPGKISLDYLIF